MEAQQKAIVTGSLRTLLQLVPFAGAISQAWSEFEGFKQTQRIEAFFEDLGNRLRDLQSDQRRVDDNVKSMPDAAELLERCVSAAQREHADTKRLIFSKLYFEFVNRPTSTSPEERVDIVHHVEQLNGADFDMLAAFARSGSLRGDTITGTIMAEWGALGAAPNNTDWLARHGPKVHSVAKLLSRGLIWDAHINAGFSDSGNSDPSFRQFRSKAWQITPMGLKVFQHIIG